MKSIILSLAIGCTLLFSNHCKGQNSGVWMFGPMVHFNIGGEKVKTSFALELSYWNFNRFPWSVDLGLEFEKGKTRLYSEAQTGVLLAGVAAGPVMEWNRIDNERNVGFQGSVWANYFLGINMRGRWIGGESFFCPGAYFKLPLNPLWDNDGNSRSGDFDDWDD